jgi:hypothetical protein
LFVLVANDLAQLYQHRLFDAVRIAKAPLFGRWLLFASG